MHQLISILLYPVICAFLVSVHSTSYSSIWGSSKSSENITGIPCYGWMHDHGKSFDVHIEITKLYIGLCKLTSSETFV